MAKKYTRKHVSSLAEIDLEQERIRYKMKRIEDGLLDIVSPQQLAISLIGRLLSRRKKDNASRQYAAPLRSKSKKNQSKKDTALSKVKEIASQPLIKKIAKKTAVSFLQWQAFNLALFLGKKLFLKIKEKRAEQKWVPVAGK